MSALFNPSREGKGIIKTNKRSFSHCLSVFFGKLFPLIKANLLFCLFMLPLAVFSVLIALSVFPDTNWLNFKFHISYIFQIMLIPLPFAFSGPAVCGLTKITRDIGREEHVDIFKDFLVTYKRCFVKSIIVSIIQYFFYVSAYFALTVYYGFWLPWAVALILTIYFTVMQKYIYVMLISLNLSVFKMFKNAYFLILVAFKKSIAILLSLIVFTIFLLLNVATSLYVNIGVIFWALYIILFHFSFSRYFQNYFAFDVILSKVVEPYYNEKSENNKEQIENEDIAYNSNSNKYTDENIEKEKSEYVFENGKLIRRELSQTESIFKDDKTE